jgi:hypothetical protein
MTESHPYQPSMPRQPRQGGALSCGNGVIFAPQVDQRAASMNW